MNKEIKIRPLLSSDAEQYVKLHNLVWEDAYKDIFPVEVFQDRANRTEQRIVDFAKWWDSNPQLLGYIAEVDNQMVGFMNATLVSNYEHFQRLGYAELMGIYIHPDYQSKGLGNKFKQLFIDWAKQNGATKFVIGVLKDNTHARAVYEKWGGKLDKYTQPFIKFDVAYDEYFYTYDL